MIILKWNIRGLEDLDKRAKVHDFIYLFGFIMVVLKNPSFALQPLIYSVLLGVLASMNERYLTVMVPREGNLLGGMESFMRKIVNFQQDTLSR